MRGKKAKALRKVIKNQINKMAINSDRDLMETSYEPVEKFAKQHMVNKDGKPEDVTLIFTQPIKMDFCFRRAYQSLKYTVKQSGQLKNVRT